MSAPHTAPCEVEQTGAGALFAWAGAELPELARTLRLPDRRPLVLLREDLVALPRVRVQVDSECVQVLPMACDRVQWLAEDNGARGEFSASGAGQIPWGAATRMLVTAWVGARRGVTQVLRRPSRIRAEHLVIGACAADLVRVRLIAPGASARVWRILEDGDGFIARPAGFIGHGAVDLRLEAGARRAAWALSDPSLRDQLVAHFWFTLGRGVERPSADAAGATRVRQGIQLAIRRALPLPPRGDAVDLGWSSVTATRLLALARLARGDGVAAPRFATDAGPWLGLWRAILLKRAAGLPASALPDLPELGAAPTLQDWLKQAHPRVHGSLVNARTPAEQAAALVLLLEPTARPRASDAPARGASWTRDLRLLLRLAHPWRVEPFPAVEALGELAALEPLDPATFSASPAEAGQLRELLSRLFPGGAEQPGPASAELAALQRARPVLERLSGRFKAIREVCAALLPCFDASISADVRVQVLAAYAALPGGHGLSPRDLAGAWTRETAEYRALVAWLRQVPGGLDPDPIGLADYQPQGATDWLCQLDRLRHLAEVLGGLPALRAVREQWRSRYPKLHAEGAQERLKRWLLSDEAEDDPALRVVVNDWLSGLDLPQDYEQLESLLTRL